MSQYNDVSDEKDEEPWNIMVTCSIGRHLAKRRKKQICKTQAGANIHLKKRK